MFELCDAVPCPLQDSSLDRIEGKLKEYFRFMGFKWVDEWPDLSKLLFYNIVAQMTARVRPLATWCLYFIGLLCLRMSLEACCNGYLAAASQATMR